MDISNLEKLTGFRIGQFMEIEGSLFIEPGLYTITGLQRDGNFVKIRGILREDRTPLPASTLRLWRKANDISISGKFAVIPGHVIGIWSDVDGSHL